jgi:hypothetical protein
MPHLYRDLSDQLSQWLQPKDRRHLQVYAEILGGLLSSGSACPSHWLPFMSHRDCSARAHLERLSYFLNNPEIDLSRYYAPIVRALLQEWTGQPMILTLDTSQWWEEYCLIEVCLVWGGRSLPLAHRVIKHASATVGFEVYRPVLESALSVLPPQTQPTLLADRGFEHGELIRWLNQHDWDWAIRAKSDLQIRRLNGQQMSVSECIPPKGEAYFFHQVQILGDISCHLATTHCPAAKEAWAVITHRSPSLQTFALYGERFGGIEPHFKDYKSAGFGILNTKIRDAQALSRLVMVMAVAQWMLTLLGFWTIAIQERLRIDWHGQRGLSFLQLGYRQLQRFQHLNRKLPQFHPLPVIRPPKAYASLKKQALLEKLIQFDKVTNFFSS